MQVVLRGLKPFLSSWKLLRQAWCVTPGLGVPVPECILNFGGLVRVGSVRRARVQVKYSHGKANRTSSLIV